MQPLSDCMSIFARRQHWRPRSDPFSISLHSSRFFSTAGGGEREERREEAGEERREEGGEERREEEGGGRRKDRGRREGGREIVG